MDTDKGRVRRARQTKALVAPSDSSPSRTIDPGIDEQLDEVAALIAALELELVPLAQKYAVRYELPPLGIG